MEPEAVDQRLLFLNTMRITEGHLPDYRAAIERAVEFAEQHAPQIMVDVFIDEGAMRAQSFQIYADSASVLQHWALSDPYIQEIMSHSEVEHFVVYGAPEPAVLERLTSGALPVTIVPRLTGFFRMADGNG